jgi:hypothetical protein
VGEFVPKKTLSVANSRRDPDLHPYLGTPTGYLGSYAELKQLGVQHLVLFGSTARGDSDAAPW